MGVACFFDHKPFGPKKKRKKTSDNEYSERLVWIKVEIKRDDAHMCLIKKCVKSR